MPDEHALGPAGGAGSINRIGEMRAGGLIFRVDIRLTGNFFRVGVHLHLRDGKGDRGGERLLRQENFESGVPRHVLQPFLRIGGIDIKISAAGLEHAEQRHDQVG